MSFHWRTKHFNGADVDPLTLDPDFDEASLAHVTAQFPSLGELTAGERKGYDASWFRVSGSRRCPQEGRTVNADR